MPRQRSDNTEAVNLKIPLSWIEAADVLAKTGAMPADVSRTGVLRAALGFGLQALKRENDKRVARKSRRKKRRRVSRSVGRGGVSIGAVRVGGDAPKGKEKQDDEGASH